MSYATHESSLESNRMSHSPSPHMGIPSMLTPTDASTDLTVSTEIKMEPEADPRVVLPLPISKATSISASALITIPTPTPVPSALILVPSFTPIGASTPTPTFVSTPSSTPTHAQTSTTSAPTSISRRPGRQGKTPKERTLNKNKPIETVNFPCHEQLSELNRQKLLELSVYPSDGISRYTRSIPFKGAKESFLKRTGRNRFDVFEYRFIAPNIKGEDKYWWVMWDYYNGLVRVHDLFDCCKPGKTEPGNAVKEKINPGLQDVCHNITGGNLHAQGYWIPYPAAKALAAKFCFRIRFALTIIFGDDFPSLCLPEIHPEFGKYAIDPEIINACQEISARQYRIEQQRIIVASTHPHPSTPPNSSSRISTVAGSGSSAASSRASPVFQANRTERLNPGVSVTPERTPETTFFDPVRGGYTNGSSNNYSSRCCQPRNESRSTSNPVPVKTSIMKKHKVEKNTKGHCSGTLSENLGASDTLLSTVPLVLQAPFPPVTGGIYFPESSMRGTQQPPHSTAPKRVEKGLMVSSLMGFSQAGGTVSVAADVPSNRHPARTLLMRNPSGSPPVEGEKGRGIAKRSSPMSSITSLRKATKAPALLLSPIENTNPEHWFHQPSNKKAKTTSSKPDRHHNPYMNPIQFAIGTFQTSGPRSSRDGSLPELQRPFTRERYEELVSRQIEESPEDLLAAEAAANLMALQRRYYERDFTEGQKGSSHLKRRRSN